MHTTPHPYAGRTVKLRDGVELNGQPTAEFTVEEWADIVFERSWMDMYGHPACLDYAIRAASALTPLPMDDEVVYGKDPDNMAHLVHVSEIAGEA